MVARLRLQWTTGRMRADCYFEKQRHYSITRMPTMVTLVLERRGAKVTIVVSNVLTNCAQNDAIKDDLALTATMMLRDTLNATQKA